MAVAARDPDKPVMHALELEVGVRPLRLRCLDDPASVATLFETV